MIPRRNRAAVAVVERVVRVRKPTVVPMVVILVIAVSIVRSNVVFAGYLKLKGAVLEIDRRAANIDGPASLSAVVAIAGAIVVRVAAATGLAAAPIEHASARTAIGKLVGATHVAKGSLAVAAIGSRRHSTLLRVASAAGAFAHARAASTLPPAR